MAGRRPSALVVDSLLAVALALGTLALVDAGDAQQATGFDWAVNQAPRDPQPGDVWNARIEVFRGDTPVAPPGGAVPLVAVMNTRTGKWTTTPARSADATGSYRARVVFREAGPYTYKVLFADELETVPVPGRGDAPPPSVPAAGETDAAAARAGAAGARGDAADRVPAPASRCSPRRDARRRAGRRHRVRQLPVRRPARRALHRRRARRAPAVRRRGRRHGRRAAAARAGRERRRLGGVAGHRGDVRRRLAARRQHPHAPRARRPAEAERRANEQRTAAEEQSRISREVHDIVGHSVSVMTIQAAAADDAFESRPAQVREALRAIESTGRGDAVRAAPPARRHPARRRRALAPASGLDSLDARVERVRRAGLTVELTAERQSDALPPSVDLAAYRIVQEALTNTLKHARATRARVDVRRRNGALEIEVVDDGEGAEAATPGHGIAGMRERAALYGGDLRPGRRRAAASWSARGGWTEDQRPDRRRPGAGASGLRMIVEPSDDLEVVGEAADGREAVELARRLRPDVILMDVRMPNVDGVEATRRLAASGSPARILILTTFDLDEHVYEALRAGASGFLLKDVRRSSSSRRSASSRPARRCSRRRSRAGCSITSRTRSRAAGRSRRRPSSRSSPSASSSSCSRAGCRAELAERLFLSETTVKTHISSVLRKLELRDRVQAVREHEADHAHARPGQPYRRGMDSRFAIETSGLTKRSAAGPRLTTSSCASRAAPRSDTSVRTAPARRRRSG